MKSFILNFLKHSITKCRIIVPATSLFCIVYCSASSQPNPEFNQNVVPPSPEAQAFLKYGLYPVDYSTGVPKIEIPIYEIKSGSLSLPVSLNYHASGIRMNELASSTGLGWSLSAGGMVSRTINQVEDERSFLSTTHYSADFIDSYQPAPDYSLVYGYVHDVAFGNFDGRSDDYFYSVGNSLSGQFVYDINKNIQQRSFSNNIITRTAQNTFEITGEDGTHYVFNDIERVNSPISGFCPSSWMISRIISNNYKDTISFEYNYFPGFAYSIESQTFNNNNPASRNDITGNLPFEKHYSIMEYSESVLVKRIAFKNGSVTFSYEGGRKDVMNNRLSAITINNVDNANIETPLKQYQLVHTYFQTNDNPNTFEAKLRLDEIRLLDQNNTYINSYYFHYNPMVMPAMINQYDPSGQPGGQICGGCAMDFWGYYNGQPNSHLIPGLPDEYGGPANRSAVETYMKAESLEKIDYPTGGSTSFEFEANQNIGAIPDPYVGGLRIKTITSTAGGNSLPVVKQYQYNSSIWLTPDAEPARFSYGQHMDWHADYNITSFDDYPVKTVYFSDPIIPMGSLNGSPVMYYSVTETMDDGNGQKQQTIYNYDFDNDRSYSIPETSKYGTVAYSDKSWARGNLINTSYYKFINGAYVLTRSVTNHYDTKQAASVNTGLNCFIQLLHTLDPQFVSINDSPLPYPYNGYTQPPNLYDFNYYDVYEETGIKKMVETDETEYDDNGNQTLNKVTTTAYESQEHLFPTQKTTTKSDGNLLISVFKYPYDFRGQAPYDEMISKNMVSPVIQLSTYKNSTAQLLSLKKTNYNDWGSNVIAPATIQQQNGTYPMETILNANYDAQANLVQLQKPGGMFTSYQWGYRQQYPVAEVKNARNDLQTVIVTSSEDVGYSNEIGDDVFIVNTDPQNTPFTTAGDNGTITINAYTFTPPSPGYIEITCTLTGPNGYSKNFALDMGDITSSSPSITITGLAAGAYTLTSSAGFYTLPNISFEANLTIVYPSSIYYTGAKEFFCENFEEGNGNSAVNDSKTGHYSYTGTYSTTLSHLTPKNYTLSYWRKTGGAWSFQIVPVVVTGSSYTINIPGAQIDDVRFYPADAEMTTYTYDPATGITSISDVNGLPVYYEYDGFQRLINIRDKDRNIIKHLDYHYQGQ